MRQAWSDEQWRLPTGCTVSVRVYPGRACRILHLHGGAFAGTVDDGRAGAEALAASGAAVHSIAYPCGPAHPFPAGLEAAYAALQDLSASRGKAKLLVAGEDSGGTLAAALALVCRDRLGPKLAGQILISPMLDSRLATASLREAGAGPSGCKWADGWRDYLGTPEKANHPYAAPGLASRLGGLPRALRAPPAAGPVRDAAPDYAARLRASGVVAVERQLASPAQTGWSEELCDAVTSFLLVHC